MADPITLAAISVGSQVVGGIAQQQASNRAAAAANKASEFNAQIIERDIDLLERQRQILNAQFVIDDQRMRVAFERDVQGRVKAASGYAGIDMSRGTPMEVLMFNARELEYQSAVGRFNNEIANMQISDAQEEARLNAQLARMEGGAAAAALRAQGTASLIRGIGGAAQTGFQTGVFGSSGGSSGGSFGGSAGRAGSGDFVGSGARFIR
jgi:hypothetical protein